MTATVPEASAPPGPRPGRRRWPYFAVAAAVVAVAATVVAGGGSKPAAERQVAPGIGQASANVAQLALNPPAGRVPAPDFTLTDRDGRPLPLDSLRGRAVVLSFNDDRCADLCTLLAQDVITANQDLGAAASRVVFLSVNANPFYPSVADVASWSSEHGLGAVANWRYVTGSPAQLEAVWRLYGVYVQQNPTDRTVTHGTQMFFIDPSGRQVAIGDFGTGSADTALFAHTMAQMAADLLPGQPRVAGPSTPPPGQGRITIGAPAPALRLAALDGSGQVGRVKGRWQVVNFWSSTCTACTAEMPALQRSFTDQAGSVSFVGVDVSDPTGAGRAFAARAGVTYPLGADPGGRAAGEWGVTGLPFTAVVAPDGRVATLHPGALTTEQLDYVLDDLRQNGS